MTAKDGKSLLDEVLDATMEAGGSTRETETGRGRGSGREDLQEQPEETEDVARPEWPGDVEDLLGVTGAELRAWLSEVNPGDLLCVVAEGSEALRQRVMSELTEESVQWLRRNLELWDPPTERLKVDARESALRVARALVAAGKIAMPDTAAGEAMQQEARAANRRDGMTETLAQLVALAHAQGVDALAELVGEIDHPMLEYGVRVLLDKPSLSLLEKRLDDRRRALEASFRAELEVCRQALLAIGRGESAEQFLERIS